MPPTTPAAHQKCCSLETEDYLKSDTVLFELITAAVRLFLARPPELQRTTGRLFRLLLSDDAISFDAQDRVLFLYRFLYEARHRPSEVLPLLSGLLDSSKRDVILGENGARFLEDVDTTYIESLEFNTLSLTFKLPPSRFLAIKNPVPFCGRFVSSSPLASGSTAPLVDPSSAEIVDTEPSYLQRLRLRAPSRPMLPAEKKVPTTDDAHGTLLSSSSSPTSDAPFLLLGEKGEPLKRVDAAAQDLLQWNEVPTDSRELIFSQQATGVFDAQSFEALWTKTSATQRITFPNPSMTSLPTKTGPDLLDAVQQAFESCHLHCVASGTPKPNVFKWFIYGICKTPVQTNVLLSIELFLVNAATTELEIRISPSSSTLTGDEVLMYLRSNSPLLAGILAV